MKSTDFPSRRSFIKNSSLAAAGLYFAACNSSKDSLTPTLQENNIFNASLKEVTTRYGCLFQSLNADEAEPKMQKAGFDLVRAAIYLSDASEKKSIDQYLENGYSVQINLNWNQTKFPSNFPTPRDYPKAKEMITAFFEKYKQYKSQIPLICFGNEWDNLNYHKNSIAYYLEALRLATRAAHTYGFKVADAGITSTAIQRWMYSQLSGAEAAQWKKNYWVGETNENYQPLLEKVEFYISKIKHIPVDYINVHWYNKEKSSNGFSKAASTYLKLCGKSEIISNEFGILIDDFDVWKKTVDEVSAFKTDDGEKVTKFALAYSGVGTGGDNKAIELTDKMLKLLANPVTNSIIE